VLLSACANAPILDTSRVDRALTPRGALSAPSASLGRTVLWGGVILSTRNLETITRIEVLAYPLDDDEMPQRGRDPLGRFILERPGFLEPATYAEGRLVTVVGTLARIQDGKIGDSSYQYPVVDAGQLHLWAKNSEGADRSNVHFGIGVGIGL